VIGLFELNDIINTIIQGDCLETLRQIPDNSIDCVVTSPPYNKHYNRKKMYPADNWSQYCIDYEVFHDDMPESEYQEWQKEVVRELVRIIKPKGSIFYNHKPRVVNHRVILPTEWLGEFNIRQVLIWDKRVTTQLASIRWLPTVEYIYWITKTNIQPKFYNRSKYKFEIISIAPEKMTEHPASFPKKLVEVLVLNTTDKGDIVLDPFMGSGTTAFVCKKLFRNYIGVELNPKYIEYSNNKLASLLF